jgi:nucleoside-diphosphate-sugar epimerase
VRVLLTGANGFIGRYLLGALLQAGHEVVPAVRRPEETDRLLTRPASVKVDFNHATEPADWSRTWGASTPSSTARVFFRGGRDNRSTPSMPAPRSPCSRPARRRASNA